MRYFFCVFLQRFVWVFLIFFVGCGDLASPAQDLSPADSTDNQDNQVVQDDEDFRSLRRRRSLPWSSPWTLSTTENDWDIVYDGFGGVLLDSVDGIILKPQASTELDETHAALVLSKKTLLYPLRDFRLTIVATTNEQLRIPTPNPWEVFWIFFNYRGDRPDSKETNYFILKPNGIELGKAYGAIDQAFLSTLPSPQLVVGEANTFVLDKKGGNIQVSVNGVVVLNYQGRDGSTAIYDQAGAIGLYTEDARVTIHSVTIEPK